MKYINSSILGIASIALTSTASAFDFDDHDRLLQRIDDKKDATPFTDKEVSRLKSMIKKGKLKARKESPNALPEVDAEKGLIARALKKKGVDKTQRTVGGGETKTAAEKGQPKEPKKEKPVNRKAPPDAKVPRNPATPKLVEKTGRNAPPPPAKKQKSLAGAERSQPQETGRHHKEYNDDYYYKSASGKGKGKGGEENYDDYYFDDYVVDDFYLDDTVIDDSVGGGGGLNYVFFEIEGFQDSRSLQAAIPPNPSLPDEFDAGTLYLFNREPVYGVINDSFSNSTSGRIVDESDEFATVTGRCLRTDPHDELDSANYLGRAYCQFVYSFLDEQGFALDELTAEGPLEIGQEVILTVTGGVGIYRRAVGEIVLFPADPILLDESPPAFEFSFEEDLPASYLMNVFIHIDESLVPPEVLF